MPIYLATSPWFIALASIAYLHCGLVLALIAWPVGLRIALFALLLYDCRRVLRAHGTRSSQQAVQILQLDCEKWRYQLTSGKCYKASLIKERSYCSRAIIIMYLQHLTGSRYVLIPRDALSEHNYRRLAFEFHNTVQRKDKQRWL